MADTHPTCRRSEPETLQLCHHGPEDAGKILCTECSPHTILGDRFSVCIGSAERFAEFFLYDDSGCAELSLSSFKTVLLD